MLDYRTFQQRADSERVSFERRRLTLALLLSLLIHAFLFSLTFGGQGLWRPGFDFPWQVRRIEAPDLRVVIIPPQVTVAESAAAPVAEPLPREKVEPPVASGPAPTPAVTRTPAPRGTTAAIRPETDSSADSSTETAIAAAPAQLPLPVDRPGDTAPPPMPTPSVIASPRTEEPALVVPAAPPVPMPDNGTAPSVSIPETAPDSSKEEEQRQAEEREAARQEAARQEATRQETARQEAARQEAVRQEAARQATRQEAARQEATRQEAARQEAARQEAARQEAARQEAARQEAARQEAARQEATRQEAARQETTRQEAARQTAAPQPPAPVDAAREAEARREARLRAIGRQLDEEADRREAAKAAARESPSLPYSYSSPRRYRLFGRTDPNEEIILYAEAWARKIQMNMTIDMVREAAKQPHTDPLVTVAVRSDGSVESVTFIQSSGVPAIDDAIRRIVDSQKPYQAFSPNLAREYDVIEIRRTWHFDVAIRLY